jgi:hypothetical protein
MKIDLGCGSNVVEGFIRIDNNPAVNADILMSIQEYVASLKDDSVDEAWAGMSLEFLDGEELYVVMNHLWRAIKKDSLFRIWVTSVVMPGGAINPRAWTVPLLKTRFSPETFKCFLGGSTWTMRGVMPWNIANWNHEQSGALQVDLTPRKPPRFLEQEEAKAMMAKMHQNTNPQLGSA